MLPGKDTPRARFEAIAVGSYWAIKQNPRLVTKEITVEEWFNQEEFVKIIGSDGANVKKRLLNRIEFVRDKLIGG